ncbi:rhodanese-like domain-containing protein, partial [Georgenia sp. 10Sc9-8]|nr:rhodanese-like domain-containing protein [Georgenia halotolerans]
DRPELTAPQLAARLAAREQGQDDVVLLDVRESGERSIVTIPGSVSVPLGTLLADPAGAAGAAGARPAGPVVVHCLSGGRSAQAQEALLRAGFRDVRNLTGGVRAWVEQVDPALPTY